MVLKKDTLILVNSLKKTRPKTRRKYKKFS